MDYKKLLNDLDDFLSKSGNLELTQKVNQINALREVIHRHSPFKNEPVDFVKWVANESVVANDYNPNKVAPPEMQLLEVSIINDGYTQPIVTYQNEDISEVIDGFHRNRVGKESKIIAKRIMGFLPIVAIRGEQSGKDARMASTIRHNRARGKHQVSAMSEIVMELKNRNWNNTRIARELGMDEDEILRLCQISGLESLFSDKDFSSAWVSDDTTDEFFEEFNEDVSEAEMAAFRIPNESDNTRIFHTYDKWESIDSGFFNTTHPKLSNEQCRYKYKEFLSDIPLFKASIDEMFKQWPNFCEHNLTNKSLNRVAWIGQASVCFKYGIPCIFSSGFQLLTEEEKDAANNLAFESLNEWLTLRGLESVSFEDAMQINRQVELY
jgi:ParB-like nuclease domain